MNMDKFEVKLYRNSQGKDIIKEYIYKQETYVIGKILHLIQALEIEGLFLRMPYTKKITSTIFELRSTGSVSIRILYASNKNVFYILNIFIKKTKKTPMKEIKLALERLNQII